MLHLLREPATQKQLAAIHEISSGTVSKHMKVLESAELARRQRSHSAYVPLFEERLRIVLREIAHLKVEIVEAKSAAAVAERDELTRSGIQLTGDLPREAGVE